VPKIKSRIYVPTGQSSRLKKNNYKGTVKRPQPKPVKRRKRAPTPVRLAITEKIEDELVYLPTLVFRRQSPACTWLVPAVKTPLYWFDNVMLRKKKLIMGIPPNTFIVDGRRFKVLAQDHHVIGVGYTRWLVYEEAAVPKGQKP
jgi:hypothetical protein